jgi:CBS domain-containing protein
MKESKKKDYYENTIESRSFKNNLSKLNTNLVRILEKNNHEPIIFGNLFYHHKVKNFNELDLNKDMVEKRVRLFNVARNSSNIFEIGFNGGHSALLCLMANPESNLIFNDLSSYIDFIPGDTITKEPLDIHPEVYVPEAIRTMEKLFPDRIVGIIGNSILEIPKFVKQNPETKVDCVHIDGDKLNYKLDFFNLIPILSDGAKIVFDDSNIAHVKFLVNFLVRAGYVSRLSNYPSMKNKYSNEIVKFENSSSNYLKKFYAYNFLFLDRILYTTKVNLFRPFKLIKKAWKKYK